jgi:hypothetical protein
MTTLYDRVQETTTTSGTGDLTLGGAVPGYRSFSTVLANGATTPYVVVGGTEWECGRGTMSGTTVLQRTNVTASSNNGSPVNFSAGTKQVFIAVTGDVFEEISGGSGGSLVGAWSARPGSAANGTSYYATDSIINPSVFTGSGWRHFYNGVAVTDPAGVFTEQTSNGGMTEANGVLSFGNNVVTTDLPSNWAQVTVGTIFQYNPNCGNLFLGLGKDVGTNAAYSLWQISANADRWYAFIEQDYTFTNQLVYLNWQMISKPLVCWFRITRGSGNNRAFKTSIDGRNFITTYDNAIGNQTAQERFVIKLAESNNGLVTVFDYTLTTS